MGHIHVIGNLFLFQTRLIIKQRATSVSLCGAHIIVRGQWTMSLSSENRKCPDDTGLKLESQDVKLPLQFS